MTIVHARLCGVGGDTKGYISKSRLKEWTSPDLKLKVELSDEEWSDIKVTISEYEVYGAISCNDPQDELSTDK